MYIFTSKLPFPIFILVLIMLMVIEFGPSKMENNDFLSPKYIPFLTNSPIEYKIKRMFENLPHDIIKSGFNRTLLIITYNHPHYQSMDLLKNVYQPIFEKVLTCGSPSKDKVKPDIEIEIDRGFFGYRCTGHIMKKFKDYEGYMVIADDMVVNWWQFHTFPKEKIWVDHPGYRKKKFRDVPDGWLGWAPDYGFPACKRFYEEIKPSNNTKDPLKEEIFKNYMSSCDGEACCGLSRSDVYYVPRSFSKAFIFLSNIAAQQRLHLEIAVPTILGSCDVAKNHEMLNGYFITANQGGLSQADLYFWNMYDTNYHYVHSMKFAKDKDHGGKNYGLFQRYYLKFSNSILGKR